MDYKFIKFSLCLALCCLLLAGCHLNVFSQHNNAQSNHKDSFIRDFVNFMENVDNKDKRANALI